MSVFRCGRFSLDLDSPKVMAIVNLTPDSFSGDGHGCEVSAALHHAERCIAEGADILDLGGESSRPGAQSVGVAEELDRVIPLVERLADCGLPLSVDTVKPEVMAEAIRAGASMINDITGFTSAAARDAIVDSEVGLCVMHMQGRPRSMQADPRYVDVVAEVSEFLRRQLAVLQNRGVAAERIVIDPGFGFGKRRAHNEALFRALPELASIAPVLVGLSRKSVLGEISGREVGQRLAASVAAAMLAAEKGARVIRVHDVSETCDALKVLRVLA